MSRHTSWRRRLDRIATAGQTRALKTLVPTGPTTAQYDGQPVIVACSNDYLGLSWHPEVRSAASGGGATSSRLICGSRPAHAALEHELERRYGQSALVFPSGYQANLAVFSTICEAGQHLASDALNHASIIDGIRLSAASYDVVDHADPGAIPAHADAIAIEGLYSMDGDVPPLGDYPTDPWLVVDEAHAVGCLGPQGLGAAAQLGVVPDIRIGTFGKAYGGAGAFVVGPPDLKALLINAGRSFIFTTAPPEPLVAMALAGLRTASDALREQLVANTRRFRTGLRQNGWEPHGAHHIVPVVVGSEVMALSDRMLARGVLAPGIRWPSVPEGQERIRFTMSAAHTADQLDQIVEALGPAPSPAR